MSGKANPLKFYCERIEADVDRNQCEHCDQLEDCKKDGYLNRIDKQLGIYPALENDPKRLENFRKKLQRALNPTYLKSEKGGAYNLKITGVTDSPTVPFNNEFCKKCVKLQDIVDILGVSLDDDLILKLSNISVGYIGTKNIWNNKPNYAASKDSLMKVIKAATKVIKAATSLEKNIACFGDSIEGLTPEVRRHLEWKCGEVGNVQRTYQGIDIDQIKCAAEELKNSFIAGSQLADYPFIICCRELEGFFKEKTGKDPTISYRPIKNKTNDQSQSSLFFKFALFFILCVDPESI